MQKLVRKYWQQHPFGFAFWVVFFLGSVLASFLISACASMLRTIGVPSYAFKIGYLSLWGYLYLAYFIFSIFYLYKKSSLLSIGQSKLVSFFLGIYACSGFMSFGLIGYISILFLLGSGLYNAITGGNLLVTMMDYFPLIGKYSLNILQCASDII